MAQMTALRRRMIDDMTVRNLSPATQQSYVYAVAKFSRFFGCSPDRLGIASGRRGSRRRRRDDYRWGPDFGGIGRCWPIPADCRKPAHEVQTFASSTLLASLKQTI